MNAYIMKEKASCVFITVYGYNLTDAFLHRPDLCLSDYNLIDIEPVR